jgi:tight adherence protein B
MKPAVAAVASLVAAVFVPRVAFAVAQGRVRRKLLNQFPDAIGLIVRAVRAGIPVTEGIAEVARELATPTGPEFKRIRDEISIGVDLETALWTAANRIRLPEYRFFVVTIVLQRETGGNLAEILESLAETIRKRKALRERAHALSAEAKTSVYILAALPFVAGAGLFVLSRAYIVRLFTTSDGKMLLGLAVVSLILGLGTMHLMIRRALS